MTHVNTTQRVGDRFYVRYADPIAEGFDYVSDKHVDEFESNPYVPLERIRLRPMLLDTVRLRAEIAAGYTIKGLPVVVVACRTALTDEQARHVYRTLRWVRP